MRGLTNNPCSDIIAVIDEHRATNYRLIYTRRNHKKRQVSKKYFWGASKTNEKKTERDKPSDAIEKEFMIGEMVFESDADRETAREWYTEHRELLLADDVSIVNNDRRHAGQRDLADLEKLERRDERGFIDKRLYAVCRSRGDLLEQIFSRRWQDLPELTADENLYFALKELTDRQKQVLFWSVIQEYGADDIAAAFCSSERNVRDIRRRALDSVRRKFGINTSARYTKPKNVRRVYKSRVRLAAKS